MRHLRRVHLIGFCFYLAGCGSSYRSTALKSWEALESPSGVESALQAYEKEVKSEKDRLLRLMDEALLLRSIQKYNESNEKLFEASKIIELAGYLDASEQVATLLSNEQNQTYQGEDFEKVLIHVYLALNFIALQNWEAALVESRRVNEILKLFINEGKRPYNQNVFSRYLSALVYEKTGEYNAAYIDYKLSLQIDPSLAKKFSDLGVDLLRQSLRMGFEDDTEMWKQKFGNSSFEKAKKSLSQRQAQVVLLLESGKSPVKISTREKHKKNTAEILVPVPVYEKRMSTIQRAKIQLADKSASSFSLESIEDTAIRHLQSRMKRVIAKALLTAGVKAGVATGVGVLSDSKELGLLTGLLLFAGSEADTRSWLLLPAKLQVAKLYLNPGSYENLEIQYLDSYSREIKKEEVFIGDLKPNEIRFVQSRSFR